MKDDDSDSDIRLPLLLQNNNRLRFPILSLKLSEIEEFKQKIIRPQHFSLPRQDKSEDIEQVIISQSQLLYALDGSIRRFQFRGQQNSPMKVKNAEPNVCKTKVQAIDLQRLQKEVYIDQKVGLDWFTNNQASYRDEDLNRSQFYLNTQRYEEDLDKSTFQLRSIQTKMKSQNISVNEVDLPVIVIPVNEVLPRYNMVKKRKSQNAIYKNDNCSILIPSSLLAPELTDQRKINQLKETSYLRNKFSQSNSHQKTNNESFSRLNVTMNQQDRSNKQQQTRSYSINQGEPYIMIKAKRNNVTQVKEVIQSSPHQRLIKTKFKNHVKARQQVELPSSKQLMDLAVQFKVLQSQIDIKPDIIKCINVEETILANEKINDLIQHLLRKRQKNVLIWKEKQRMQGQIPSEDMDEVSSQSSEEEILDVPITIIPFEAEEKKIIPPRNTLFKQHSMMIKKLRRITLKLEQSHSSAQQSQSLHTVMDYQVKLINGLNDSKAGNMISRQAIKQLEEQFANILYPLQDIQNHNRQ